MKYRRWSPEVKAKIVMEGLSNTIPISELCIKYHIDQSQYRHWLNELQANAKRVFETTKTNQKEEKMHSEIRKLKSIIAELSIELKKTELELNEGDGL